MNVQGTIGTLQNYTGKTLRKETWFFASQLVTIAEFGRLNSLARLRNPLQQPSARLHEHQ